MDNTNDKENIDKIKLFYSNDEKLKILGELLSNKSSRDIIKMLIINEMYANEIAKKLNLRPNLVFHHLSKMESIGLLEITKKKIIQKGEEHRFFKIPSGMLIFPEKAEKETHDRFLQKIFKDKIRIITAIGITAISGIATSLYYLDSKAIQVERGSDEVSLQPGFLINEFHIFIIVSAVFAIVTGLWFFKKRKKN